VSAAAAGVATAAPPAATVIAEDLAHRYAPGRGLDPIGFTLTAPGVVAITGPNGSGKSTLLRIVAGLLRPSAGRCRVEVGGHAVEAQGVRRTAVGYAAPELAFYEELTVAENLEFVARARDGGRTSPRRALERVGLGSRAWDRVAELSSGMKQRLRLAFAVLHDPPVLLLDEPGSHLDDAGRAVVRALVHDQRARGLALIATNDEREWDLAVSRIELRGRGLGDPA
jgi:heme exporter protein A